MSSSAPTLFISPIPLPELDLSPNFSERFIKNIVSSDSQASGLQCWHEASQTQRDNLPLITLRNAFIHAARLGYLELMRCLWQHAQTRVVLPNISPDYSQEILMFSAFPAAIQSESLESISLLWAFAGKLNLQQQMLQAECEEGLYQPFIKALNADHTETAVHLLTLAYALNDDESNFDAMLAQITDEAMRENLSNHTTEAYQTIIETHQKVMTDGAHNVEPYLNRLKGINPFEWTILSHFNAQRAINDEIRSFESMPADVNSLCVEYAQSSPSHYNIQANFGFFTPRQSEEKQRNDPKAAPANI